MNSPTDAWLAHVADDMPPLTESAGTAERLLLLIHYGINWEDSWLTTRRAAYWDRLLPDRVIAATYRTDQLRRWWRDVADALCSSPRNQPERLELERHLRADSLPVLELLRHETEALLLRTRITADAVRTTRATRQEPA